MQETQSEFQANPNGIKSINHPSQVYPNPANQSLTIRLEEGQLSGIQLSSFDGKLIKEKTTLLAREYQLDTSSIPEGLYWITCLHEDGSKEYIRVVISH